MKLGTGPLNKSRKDTSVAIVHIIDTLNFYKLRTLLSVLAEEKTAADWLCLTCCMLRNANRYVGNI